MKLLAITSFRPHEVAEPIEHVDANVQLVVIDPSKTIVHRVVDAFRLVNAAIREHRPDVVLLDCYEVVGVVVTLLSLWYRVPVVCRLVGNPWDSFREVRLASRSGQYRRAVKSYPSLYLNQFIYRQATGFVVVSNELKRVVERRTNCQPDRIRVVHVPVPDGFGGGGSAGAARRRFGIRESRVVFTATNLSFKGKYDGVKDILDEIIPILESDGDVAYVVAGGGAYHSSLLAFLDRSVTDPDVRRRIYTPGFVDDIADLYALADVFAYVSYIDGYPNAVLEAQAEGLAVVANAAHGMTDQIDTGDTGVLADPAVEGEFRSHVRRLLDDPVERTRLGQNARERVLCDNTSTAIGRQFESALGDIVDSSRTG